MLFNNGEVMVEGYGNSKKQAERNASIQGLEWLRRNAKQVVAVEVGAAEEMSDDEEDRE